MLRYGRCPLFIADAASEMGQTLKKIYMFSAFLLRHNASSAAIVINSVVIPDVGHERDVENC